LRKLFFLLFSFAFSIGLRAQVSVSGTVYDISKINYVENVRVVSTSGVFTISDSMGRYTIIVNPEDSLTFHYNNKPTQKFAVSAMSDPSHFNISLRIPVKGKYSLLNEVTVFSKSYRQDSLENRQAYADIYDYTKPGVRSSISPSGATGADLNELINVFRFKRNKRIKAFQRRLEQQEQEKYVNYRFSKVFVKRITGLQSPELDSFLVWYRPDYEFARNSDELAFNQYILNAFYQFRKWQPASPARKIDEPAP